MDSSEKPFVIVPTWNGTMIVNRLDRHDSPLGMIGVGMQLLTQGAFDREEVISVTQLLALFQSQLGRPLVAYDLGANIGCHCIKWALELGERVQIVAVEAQRYVYYQLCGNVVINNLFNIEAIHAAMAAEEGELTFREPDYRKEASFGSLELRRHERSEDIGQKLDDRSEYTVRTIPLDKLSAAPPDFIKLDIEGMELEVLQAAKDFLETHKPAIFCEVIKVERAALEEFFQGLGYRTVFLGVNVLAIEDANPIWNNIKIETVSPPAP